MKSKKGALEPDKYLVGFVVFSIVSITFLLLIMSFNANYDEVNINTSYYTDSFNLSEELYNTSTGQREATLGKDLDEANTPDSMFAGVFAATRFLRDSFGYAGNIIASIYNVIPLPPILKGFLLTILSIWVIFALVYLVFRFQPR